MTVSTASRKSHLVAIGLAVALFGAGGLAGIAVERMWLSPSSDVSMQHADAHSPDVLVERFRTRLELTDEQTGEIRTILEALHDNAKTARSHTRETMRTEHERARAQILELLTPEQRVRYKDMLKKLHGKHRKHRERHGQGRRHRKHEP